MSEILSQVVVMRVGDDLMTELARILKIPTENILILNAKFIKKAEFHITMEVEYQRTESVIANKIDSKKVI